MRKLLTLMLGVLLTANIADAQYSDASLNGPWIMFYVEDDPENPNTVFIIFDGQGSITDMGIFNPSDSLGTYSVDSTGSFIGFLYFDDIPLEGQIISDTTAVVVLIVGEDSLSASMVKVMDEGACQGNWSGSFVQDTTGVTIDVQMTVDEFGEIQSLTGLVGPVTGRFFFEPDYLAGFIYSEETGQWDQIMVTGGALIGDTMTGTFELEWGDYHHGTFSLEREPLSIINDYSEIPTGYYLSQNFPNPFNPFTTITYDLPEKAYVELTIYNVLGRKVETLVGRWQSAGRYELDWNAEHVPSGIYFVKMESEWFSQTRKLMLLK